MVLVAKRKKSEWSGALLRSIRERVGLTQAELAEGAGVYPADISKYERDVSEPTFTVLVNLAGALGVSLSEFKPADE